MRAVVVWLLRGLGAALLMTALFFGVQFARTYTPPPVVPSAEASLPPNVTFRLEQLSVVGRNKNQIAWTLSADRLDTTRDHRQLDFSGNIRAQFTRQGKPPATVTAPAASYATEQNQITVSGPIHCLVPGNPGGSDNLRVVADRLAWNVGARQVRCPGAVTVTLGDAIATGRELTVDLKTRDVSLRNFRVRIPVDETEADPVLPTSFPELR